MPDKLSAPRRRVLVWLVLFLLAAIAFAWVAIPFFKIRPFAPQTTEALKLSYALRGRELKKVDVLKDYWFDWKIYNPRTLVYTIGAQ